MTKKVFNMQGGLHSAAAFTAFENAAWGSCVANAGSFTVSAGTGMNVQIAAGDGIISTQNSGKRIQTDAVETAAVAAASPSYSRIDTVVAYIDNAVVPTTSVVDNTNGVLKFASVAGTAAATPLAPSAAAIQSAIGAGNAYMALYNVTVPSNATNLTAATFTDMRKVLMPVTSDAVGIITAAMLASNSVTTVKVGDLQITNSKIANDTITAAKLAANISGAFSAYDNRTTGTAIPTSVFTRVDYNTELFDVNNWFDTVNARYTPQVAGYYQLNAFVGLLSVGDTATIHVVIRKNGTNLHWTRVKQSGGGEAGGMVNCIAYANGSTDYFDVAVFSAGGNTNVGGSQQNHWFNGARV